MAKYKDTDFGIIPTTWQVLSFEECLKIKGRVGWKGYKTSDLRSSGPIVIGGTNIKNTIYLDYTNPTYLSREKFEESPEIILKSGDVILVTRGNGIGDTAYFDGSYEEATINPSLVILSDFIGHPKFLCYYLISPVGRNEVLSHEGGSSIPALYQGLLKKVLCPLPPIPEQQAIAEVLSSLDDKIDLLHRNNKTLEQMAETVVKNYTSNDSNYCDTVSLGDLIEIHDSKRIPLSCLEREKLKDGDLYPYYGAATIMDYISKYIFDGDYLLLGEDGSVETEEGYPILQRALGKCWVNNHTHVLTAINPYSNDLLEIVLRNTSISHIVTGAVQPKINQASLKSLEVIVPKIKYVNQVTTLIDPLYQKKHANIRQISILGNIRDTLLPKLMSGQVRVKLNT